MCFRCIVRCSVYRALLLGSRCPRRRDRIRRATLQSTLCCCTPPTAAAAAGGCCSSPPMVEATYASRTAPTLACCNWKLLQVRDIHVLESNSKRPVHSAANAVQLCDPARGRSGLLVLAGTPGCLQDRTISCVTGLKQACRAFCCLYMTNAEKKSD